MNQQERFESIKQLSEDEPATCDVCGEERYYWTVYDDDVVICQGCQWGYPGNWDGVYRRD